jgi:nucleotide-binding universal stress UspA family protein
MCNETEEVAMFKDILVRLDEGASGSVATGYAVSLARRFGAHIAGLAFAYEPVTPGTLMSGMPATLFEQSRIESEKQARSAIASFEGTAQGASLAYSSHLIQAPAGDAFASAAVIARRFDLTVVRQESDNDEGRQSACIEAVLFGSGRPAIVVPYIHKDEFKADRVLVCWDGGQHAARAIADSLPLLRQSRQIEVVTVAGSDKLGNKVPGADIGAHLARHGLKISVHEIVAPDIGIADAILSHAADMAADFIVMGGYGHSRLREFVLGGVTRTVLATMTVPVFLAH